ncbi:MAG: transketolase [Elusimicrobiota bacterium]|jgi:transketolase
MQTKIERLEKKAQHIRELLLKMCCRAGTGHVTSAFSCTEIMVALYYGGLLRFDPKNPEWAGRDRFILSKGQASVLLYPILADLGFYPVKELDKFNSADGMFGVHLQHDVPGVEITSGSLGHGIGLATGLALAFKMDREWPMVYALLGDAECYEGSVWEAAMFASHHRLSNLVAIIDRNHMGATNFTEHMVELEPLADKWRAFGWDVVSVNGHSFEQLLGALDGLRSRKVAKPRLVIADTVKGKGIPFMCYDPLWHACVPKGEKQKMALDAVLKGEEA